MGEVHQGLGRCLSSFDENRDSFGGFATRRKSSFACKLILEVQCLSVVVLNYFMGYNLIV